MTAPALTYAQHMAMALDSRAFAAACGFDDLDPWQADLLDDDRDTIALCSRQSGKSLALALKSLRHALFTPASTALLVSAGQRQAAEILAHAKEMYQRIGRPVVTTSENVSQMVLEGSGSRIISLPSMPSTVRGYSPSLICCDEASQIPDSMWEALRPMQSVTGAQMILAGTPFGRRGFMFHEWTESGPQRWRKVKVTADQCKRIDKAWLAEEMQSGAAWYVRQEFFCEFSDFEEQIFSSETIDRIFTDRIGVVPITFGRSAP